MYKACNAFPLKKPGMHKSSGLKGHMFMNEAKTLRNEPRSKFLF